MLDLTMSQTERDAAVGIICFALVRPDMTVSPCHSTLPMHRWLCDHGMAPGIDADMQPAFAVVDLSAARAAAGTVPLPATVAREERMRAALDALISDLETADNA